MTTYVQFVYQNMREVRSLRAYSDVNTASTSNASILGYSCVVLARFVETVHKVYIICD